MKEWGSAGDSISVGGWVGFKDREDQSIGDPFWVDGAEFPSAALRFLSSRYPVRHPEGHTVGHRGDGGRRGEEVDSEQDREGIGAAAMVRPVVTV
ncbi:hypothetical protein PBY51_015443 [Eleginops maclovinus]|uniref:Uncharacterized protein n=1 Tax=Eleginops maclovinus TaxID=56733 RepID=A0AAN8ABY5_ELEMC|nr:hypothetical protein PBY51_015443 [Eleginops maclovinus]